LIVAAALFPASCADDDSPEDQPVTTVTDEVDTGEVPSDGTTRIEPGTNLTPTSDEVPGPTATDVPGLGDGSATTTD